MERHKSLYKENSSVLSPRNHKRLNRVFNVANRAKRRSELFLSGRNISPTSSPPLPLHSSMGFTSTPAVRKLQPESKTPRTTEENKENGGGDDAGSAQQQQATNMAAAAGQATGVPAAEEQPQSLRIAQVATKANPTTRQEAFLLRFVEWKQRKKEKAADARRPFILSGSKPAVPTANGVKNLAGSTSSFAPRGHQFKPPAGLKQPQIADQPAASVAPSGKQRRSIYITVDTQRKIKQQEQAQPKNFPITRKALPVGKPTHPTVGSSSNLSTRPLGASAYSVTSSDQSTWTVTKIVSAKCGVRATSGAPLKRPAVQTVNGASTDKPIEKTTTHGTVNRPPPIRLPAMPPSQRPLARLKANAMPPPPPQRPLERLKANAMPPPPPPPRPLARLKANAIPPPPPGHRSGAANKAARLLQDKRVAASAGQRKPVNPKLAHSMKAKKPGAASSTAAVLKRMPPAALIVGRKPLYGCPRAKSPVAETPTDLAITTQFDAFVTSTMQRLPPRSPTVTTQEFSKLCDTISPVDGPVVDNPETAPPLGCQFNFIRYSATGDMLMDISAVLSPAAKVPAQPPTEEVLAPAAPGTPAELRGKLQAVNDFRRHLADEIARLHGRCEQWEAYKAANAALLLETGGEDMVDVTVGQTRLLTSKKFMQFQGLIDRCEAGVRGRAADYDGSERTKPITVVDLEGFWSMLGLQVDNLDKRFENLERWRGNNWVDPEQAPQLVIAKKRTAGCVKKPKAANNVKPSRGLQQMMQAMRKKQEVAAEVAPADDVIVLTPTGQWKPRRSLRLAPRGAASASGQSTPTGGDSSRHIRRSRSGTPNSPRRHCAVLVRDRKSFSQAPTIIRILKPTQRPSLHNSQDSSPKISPAAEELRRSLREFQATSERNNLLKTVLLGPGSAKKQQRGRAAADSSLLGPPRTPLQVPSSHAALKVCKSILKTPGTEARRKAKSVVLFDDTPRIRQFKFTMLDDTHDSDNDADAGAANHDGAAATQESDAETSRTYSLRNRRVRLRPSCEIVIP